MVPSLAEFGAGGPLAAALNTLEERFESVRDSVAAALDCAAASVRAPMSVPADPAGGTALRIRRLWRPWLSQGTAAGWQYIDNRTKPGPAGYAFAVDSWHSGLLDPTVRLPPPGTDIATCGGLLPGSSARGQGACFHLGSPAETLIPWPGGDLPLTPEIGGWAPLLAALLVEQGVEGSAPVAALCLDGTDAATTQLGPALARLRAGLAALDRLGLSEWVCCFLSSVVPLASAAPYSGRYSVSDPDVPGTAAIDLRGPLPDLVEALVHEASHQALYLTEAALPLLAANPQAASPFRSGTRTLRRVLAGAHAFANSARALQALARGADDGPALQDRIGTLHDKTGRALATLRESGQLTAEGHRWVAALDAGQRAPRPRTPARARRDARAGRRPVAVAPGQGGVVRAPGGPGRALDAGGADRRGSRSGAAGHRRGRRAGRAVDLSPLPGRRDRGRAGEPAATRPHDAGLAGRA